MRVAVIGATGHIGSYLVPALVARGHEVVALSRGQQQPYHDDPAWEQVRRVEVDRDAEDAAGSFADRVADLGADVVVDLICFSTDAAAQLIEALRGRDVAHLHCGTVWVHGPGTAVPVAEDEAREAFGDYGTQKAAIEEMLHAETRAGGLRSVVLHPGHISGPGWPVINPAGNLDPEVWRRLATGEEVVLPHFGLETLHHVHAHDVAQAFWLAIDHVDVAAGESFHVVSDRALTLRGYAAAAARWFAQEARLRFVSWPEYEARTEAEHARATWEHIARSPSASIAKAQRLLGYQPQHTSLQTAHQAVQSLLARGEIDLPPGTDLSPTNDPT